MTGSTTVICILLKIVAIWAVAMEGIKCLLHKREDWSLDPKNPGGEMFAW